MDDGLLKCLRNPQKKAHPCTRLAYPNFYADFVLETDASYQGLGAVLSQRLMDQKLHPVAFASRALSPSEKNYSVRMLGTRDSGCGLGNETFSRVFVGPQCTGSDRPLSSQGTPRVPKRKWKTRSVVVAGVREWGAQCGNPV